jgi:hypothetical protein
VSWEPPVKRGRRTFSDERFYTSLSEQARGGKPLSPAQQRALGNLAVRYRQQISGFEALSRDCGLGAPATATAADSAQVQPLLSLLGVIKQWAPPVKRGRRVYNDSEFAESVRQQFARKGSLSERQVKAVQKLLGRYAEQIPDYAAQAAALGLPGPKAEPEPVGTACPKCGAPLVKRTARSRPFVGCSAFPKCRYVARGSVATAGQGGAGEAGSAEPAPTQDATPTRQP